MFWRAEKDLIGLVFKKKYRVLEEAGKGGMSVVYRATRLDGGADVALKIPAGIALEDKAAMKRLLQEGRLLTELNHAALVQVLELGKDHGHYFIAMEFLGGGTLKDMIVKEGIFAEEKAVEIIRTISLGLGYVHKFSIIHGDLKPSNIMLDSEGHFKIADFGLAQLDLEGEAQEKRRTGTPMYMSPEQVKGDRLDRRTDIYSLGVTLYEMLTTRVPFPGTDLKSVLTKQLMFVPKSPRVYNHGISIELEKLILRMLDKMPDHRPRTVEEFLKELDRIKHNPSGA